MNDPRKPSEAPSRPNLRDFDPYTDRNGQGLGQDEARDVGLPDRLQHTLQSDPGWPAEAARIASDFPRQDAIAGGSVASVEAVEAATPPENLRRISDPSPTPKG
ncbi:hypothetical protein ASF49_14955 [Methylobacterium sp. Leaf104]|uniref:hypothetical protein n=1 Tax=Methylobacterium TaxID=407 RepID=UPI0006FD2FA0|nr:MULTISPECIES: hypothetical protein [Methylobacterium]KQP29968.1 hypothetical protein ASF49_14955 [Methylobacterium sp. Leaf104]MCI9882331.1 hypothetical protein [Methylobacterium goesingense]